MAERRQKSFDNQNSDELGTQDKLVPQTGQQVDTYHARGTDFPVKKVVAGHGQSSDDAGQQDKLVPWGGNLESPREVEVPGVGEKDSMSTRQAAVASNFKVSVNRGESEVGAVSPTLRESIDCETGKISVSGYKQTRIKEVEDGLVSIG